jgi:hypothetical protein
MSHGMFAHPHLLASHPHFVQLGSAAQTGTLLWTDLTPRISTSTRHDPFALGANASYRIENTN